MAKKPIYKIKKLKGGWLDKYRYAWLDTLSDILRQPLFTMLTIIVISISITIPTIFYMVWKNISQINEKWYQITRITIFLDKNLYQHSFKKHFIILSKIKNMRNIDFLLEKNILSKFLSWLEFNSKFTFFKKNKLSSLGIMISEINFQNSKSLLYLSNQLNKLSVIKNIRIYNNWFMNLSLLTDLIGKITIIISIFMVITIFLVISNNIRSNIFFRRDMINVMKLIGATNSFVMRSFLNSGIILGFLGSLLALALSIIFMWKINSNFIQITSGFIGIRIINIQGFLWNEILIIIFISTIIGWITAWLTTIQYLRSFAE
ncbi:Cell division protein FtsX [Candidatus Arsenophonus lipoptenae]|uniref:Cell division protein FtsX n=1 Tax=Candidatus Arsenophonus lipoptenae TaxID=634113 RepID=A0A0X8CY29_9GAMM|nr:FtsX-like permease family protein [Candidatus Arsenophonus lipoptenae]AMA64992.1 Cell division protein FtsX [Candidatus Arsenophonus lipoptenae]